MPPVINPRSQGSQFASRLIAGQSAASVPGPRTGLAWGFLVARMEERVLPPGGVERTYLRYERCENTPHCGDPGCMETGKCFAGGRPMLWCGICGGGLVIFGPLTAPLGVGCKECGGRDLEVQADTAVPPGYIEAMTRIAEWNDAIDQRAKRRKECITPFDWLPLWHPGVSWRRQ